MSRRAPWIALAWLILLLLGGFVYSDLAWRKRQQERELAKRVKTLSTLIDIGIELRVVKRDDAGEELLPGKPKLRIVDIIRRGGILDTRKGQLVAPSQRRRIWYCSEAQFPVIVHGHALPLGLLTSGSEGSGKTTILPRWFYFRWLEVCGENREMGMVAPTNRRLRAFVRELRAAFSPRWFDYVKVENVITLADGTRIQLLSAHERSKDEGSQIQSFTWTAAACDEYQDAVQASDNIEARGRGGKIVNGVTRFKQLRTYTPKNSSAVRDVVAKLLSSGFWSAHKLFGPDSPFINPDHWERLRATLSPREYRRRVLAMDEGPERQTYLGWTRGEHPDWNGNLRPVPDGAIDVTAEVLRPWGEVRQLLVGHDPGRLYDVSIFHKAYQLPMTKADRDLRVRFGIPLWDWFAVDEVTTELTTVEEHVKAVLERARSRWRCNLLDPHGKVQLGGPSIFVRADPYSDSANKTDTPDRSVYTVWRQHNVKILPAAMNGNEPAKIPLEGRIDMLCRLICSASGLRRFYVACDERRVPAAPKLVESLETSERDELGRPEMNSKDRRDPTHWPAASGYALWALERPRIVREAA